MVSNMTAHDGCGCAPAADSCGCGDLVIAGGVYTASCTATDEPVCECSMAVICCPIQTYVAGFCPAEALQCGTLFPELVSTYQSGC